MQKNKKTLNFKKAIFPAIMTIVSFDIATTETKDIGEYERVLRLTDDSLTQHFPKQIPNDAENVYFMHQPRFMQGGEILELSFQTDSETIQNYKYEFSEQAKWIGQNEEVSTQEYEFLTWGEVKKLPEDFTMYILSSKPYKANDWNHGEFSLVAINEKDNEIIFLMENW